MDKEKYMIKKKYLAESMAFLGFKYYKEGYGKDTEYIFQNNHKFRQALTGLMQLKEEVGQYLE